MVCLVPSAEKAKEVALDHDGAEAPQDIHTTLAFIGERGVDGVPDDDEWPGLYAAAEQVAKRHPPQQATLSGTARFMPGDNGTPYVGIIGCHTIHDLHDDLVKTLKENGVAASDKFPFVPHTTLAYLGEGEADPVHMDEPVDLSFDHIVVKNGEQTRRFSLEGNPIEKAAAAWTMSPKEHKKLQEISGRISEVYGNEGGGCHEAAEWIENDLGFPMESGAYVTNKKLPKNEYGTSVGFGDHSWNRLPDGSILDLTHRQFRKSSDPIQVFPPGHPMQKRYHAFCGDLRDDHDCRICGDPDFNPDWHADCGDECAVKRRLDKEGSSKVAHRRVRDDPHRAARARMREADEAGPEGHLASLGRPGRHPANPEVRAVARGYMESRGLPYDDSGEDEYAPFSEETSKRVADAFEAGRHDPTNPTTSAAYEAFKSETRDQYDHLVKHGYSMVPWAEEGQPYEDSHGFTEDIRRNRRLNYFKTLGTETEMDRTNPLLEDAHRPAIDTRGKSYPQTYNDVFRAVHDIYGHAKEGNQTGQRGEENAWRQHARMYSPLARRAMTTETRGQNSWVNSGAHMRRADGSIPQRGEADYVRPQDRVYADQKTMLLPPEFSEIASDSMGKVAFRVQVHDTLDPILFQGDDMWPQARGALRSHLVEQLVQAHLEGIDGWLHLTAFGSGVSYNWGEDAGQDLDVQVWVDPGPFHAANPSGDAGQRLRDAVIAANLPSIGTILGAGSEAVQFVLHEGRGTSEEVLAKKPYAAYDLDAGAWIVHPEPLDQSFYDQQLKSPGAVGSTIRDEAKRHLADFHLAIAGGDRRAAEEAQSHVKRIYRSVMQLRDRAYSPHGKGINDWRDAVHKGLEQDAVFTQLKSAAESPLPWENTASLWSKKPHCKHCGQKIHWVEGDVPRMSEWMHSSTASGMCDLQDPRGTTWAEPVGDQKESQLQPPIVEGPMPEVPYDKVPQHLKEQHGVDLKEVAESGSTPEDWHEGLHSERLDQDLSQSHWHVPGEKVKEQHAPVHEYVGNIGEIPYYVAGCYCGWTTNVRSEQAADAAWERHVKKLDEGGRREKAGDPHYVHPAPHTKRWGAEIDDKAVQLLELDRPERSGFTLHPGTGEVLKRPGYLVSIQGHEERMPVSEVTPERLERYRSEHKEALAGKNRYWGGWKDPDDDHAYLDVSEHVPSLERARNLANQNYQRQFFRLPNVPGDKGEYEDGLVDSANRPLVGLASLRPRSSGAHLTLLGKSSGSQAYREWRGCLSGRCQEGPLPTSQHQRPSPPQASTTAQNGSDEKRASLHETQGTHAHAGPRTGASHQQPQWRAAPSAQRAQGRTSGQVPSPWSQGYLGFQDQARVGGKTFEHIDYPDNWQPKHSDIGKWQSGSLPTTFIKQIAMENEPNLQTKRDRAEHWGEFRDNIKEHGIKEPLLLMVNDPDDDRPAIQLEGHRRLLAAEELGLPEVPVEVRYFGTTHALGKDLFQNAGVKEAGVSSPERRDYVASKTAHGENDHEEFDERGHGEDDPEHYHDYVDDEGNGWDLQTDDYLINDDRVRDDGNDSADGRLGGGRSHPEELAWQHELRNGFVPEDLKDCGRCKGAQSFDCKTCGGAGIVRTTGARPCKACSASGIDRGAAGYRLCAPCEGKGSIQNTQDCKACGGYGRIECKKCGGEGSVGTNEEDIHRQIWANQHDSGYMPGVWHLRSYGSSEELHPCEHQNMYRDWEKEFHKGLATSGYNTCSKCQGKGKGCDHCKGSGLIGGTCEGCGITVKMLNRTASARDDEVQPVRMSGLSVPCHAAPRLDWPNREQPYHDWPRLGQTTTSSWMDQVSHPYSEEAVTEGKTDESPVIPPLYAEGLSVWPDDEIARWKRHPVDVFSAPKTGSPSDVACPTCSGTGGIKYPPAQATQACTNCAGIGVLPHPPRPQGKWCLDCMGDVGNPIHKVASPGSRDLSQAPVPPPGKGVRCPDCNEVHSPAEQCPPKEQEQLPLTYGFKNFQKQATYYVREQGGDTFHIWPIGEDGGPHTECGAPFPEKGQEEVWGEEPDAAEVCPTCLKNHRDKIVYEMHKSYDEHVDGVRRRLEAPEQYQRWERVFHDRYLPVKKADSTEVTPSERRAQVQRVCVKCGNQFSESEHGEASGFCGSCREKEGLVDHHSWSEKGQEGHYGSSGKPGYVPCKTCDGEGCTFCKGSGLIDAYVSGIACLRKQPDGYTCTGRVDEDQAPDGQRRTTCGYCGKVELHGPMYNQYGERCPLCKSSDQTFDGEGGVKCNNCTWEGISRGDKYRTGSKQEHDAYVLVHPERFPTTADEYHYEGTDKDYGDAVAKASSGVTKVHIKDDDMGIGDEDDDSIVEGVSPKGWKTIEADPFQLDGIDDQLRKHLVDAKKVAVGGYSRTDCVSHVTHRLKAMGYDATIHHTALPHIEDWRPDPDRDTEIWDDDDEYYGDDPAYRHRDYTKTCGRCGTCMTCGKHYGAHENPRPMRRGRAIVGVGIPASGKSTYLQPFAQQIGAAYVSSDETRREVTGSEADVSKDEEVWPVVYQKISAALDEGDVVVDATNSNGEKRRDMVAHLKEKAFEVHAVVFDAPLDVALARNDERDRHVPPEVIRQMHQQLEEDPPWEGEGFDSITHVGATVSDQAGSN